MSDRSRAPVRRPRPGTVAAIAVTAFVGLMGFLGIRVATGDDPALGSGPETAARTDRPAPTVSSVIDDARQLLSGDEPDERSGDDGPSLVDTAVSAVAGLVLDGDDEGDDDGASSTSPWDRSAPNPSTGSSGG